ncbi:uncharacterized protein M6B38_195100 [Iris pallida]|uniref:DUF4283 domain-containing protein n=1 Tax=Iris pallida TaxID=29817 RepID=A0AAX6EDP1_IRIPA|nr:uncharacterized protein M6B38_195100 [Iris pallida]
MLLRPLSEADFLLIRSCASWIIVGSVMRVLRRSPGFTPQEESPIAPVWLSLPGLPQYLFDSQALFSIAGCLGTPLKIDRATAMHSRLSLARILVEIDTSELPPSRFRILHPEGNSRWQPVLYERLPEYCSHSLHQGHSIVACRRISREETTVVGDISVESNLGGNTKQKPKPTSHRRKRKTTSLKGGENLSGQDSSNLAVSILQRPVLVDPVAPAAPLDVILTLEDRRLVPYSAANSSDDEESPARIPSEGVNSQAVLPSVPIEAVGSFVACPTALAIEVLPDACSFSLSSDPFFPTLHSLRRHRHRRHFQHHAATSASPTHHLPLLFPV